MAACLGSMYFFKTKAGLVLYVYICTYADTYNEELAPADVARVEEVRLGRDEALVVVLEPARVRPGPDVGAVRVRKVLFRSS